MVRIHFIIEMIWWTGLAPRELESPFPGKTRLHSASRPAAARRLPSSFEVAIAVMPELVGERAREVRHVPGKGNSEMKLGAVKDSLGRSSARPHRQLEIGNSKLPWRKAGLLKSFR